MEKQREEIYYEDEIDLYELWLKLRKRWKVVFGTVVLFLLASAVYLFITEPVYKTSFMVKVPDIITPSEAAEYVNSIDKLLEEERYKDIEKLLSINNGTVLKIHRLSARELRKSKQTIEVTLEVYDPEVIGKLSKGILDYLNRNELVAEKLDIRKKELEEKAKVISDRIRALKETKKLINRLVSQGGEVYFNPAEIDKTIQDFESQLISIRAQLRALKGFEVSVSPTMPEKPAKPKKSLILAVSLVSSLFLGIFLAFFMEWLEEAKRRHEGANKPE